MKGLYLFSIFFFSLDELFSHGVDELVFPFELIVFIVNYPLQSVDGLLGSLVDFKSFVFVVGLLIFLVIDESPRIVFKLTCR